MKNDPCWNGYKMVGTKKKGGKTVPNCVPVQKESTELLDEANTAIKIIGGTESRHVRDYLKKNGFSMRQTQNNGGHEMWVHPDGRSFAIPRHKGDLSPGILNSAHKVVGKGIKMNEEKLSVSLKTQAANVKKYGSSEKGSKDKANPLSRMDGDPTDYIKDTPRQSPLATVKKIVKEALDKLEEDAKGYKNPSGGLTPKGRKAYHHETGGTLLPPVKDPENHRHISFCARMGGMKEKLTSDKTANDPESRINKSLRNWTCE